MNRSFKQFAIFAALGFAVLGILSIFIFNSDSTQLGDDDRTQTESASAMDNAELAAANRDATDAPKRVVAKSEHEVRTQLQFDKSHAGICVTLKLVDTGEFIGGASVALEDGRQKPRASVVESNITNNDGFLAFIVKPESPYRLHIQFPAKSDKETMDVTIPPIIPGDVFVATLEVPRRPPYVSFGRLLDATTRKPVAGAEIEYVRNLTANPNNSIVETVKSDSRGEFRLGVKELKDQVFRTHANGYQTALIQFESVAETRAQAIEYILSPGAGLKVIVMKNEAPAANVSVSVSTKSDLLDASVKRAIAKDKKFPWSRRTDSMGAAVFSQLPPSGPYEIEVSSGGSFSTIETLTIPLISGKVTEHRIQLKPSCIISGTVVDQNGAPVSNCSIQLNQASADSQASGSAKESKEADSEPISTNSAGQFTFRDIPPGDYIIDVEGDSDSLFTNDRSPAIAARPFRFSVKPNTPEMNITIHADRDLYISGKLVDENGKPIARGSIHCKNATENDWEFDDSIQTKADGSFRCGPLASGEYLLYASRRQSIGTPADKNLFTSARAGSRDVQLVITSNARVVISLTNVEPETEVTHQIVAGKRAIFSMDTIGLQNATFDGLDAGEYAVVSSTESGMFAIAPLFALGKNETKEVKLQLEAGGKIRVNFKNSDKSRGYAMFNITRGGAHLLSKAIAAASSEPIFNVPSGLLELTFRSRNGGGAHSFIVNPGETYDVEIP